MVIFKWVISDSSVLGLGIVAALRLHSLASIFFSILSYLSFLHPSSQCSQLRAVLALGLVTKTPPRQLVSESLEFLCFKSTKLESIKLYTQSQQLRHTIYQFLALEIQVPEACEVPQQVVVFLVVSEHCLCIKVVPFSVYFAQELTLT